MDELRYRRAEPADVPVLALLPSQGEPGDAADPRMLPYLLGEHHPQQALVHRVMWMALDGDSPIGYIAGHLTRRLDCEPRRGRMPDRLPGVQKFEKPCA